MFFFQISDPYSSNPVFIDSGSPDSYLLTNEFADALNETSFNSSFPPFLNGVANETQNSTQLTNEPVGEVILMAVLSLILGLMILVTVIGEWQYYDKPKATHTQSIIGFVP